MPAARRRVLLTGSSGFVGGEIAAALRAAGHAVTGLSRDGRGPGDPVLRADLAGPPDALAAALAAAGPLDAVIHAAVAPHRFHDRPGHPPAGLVEGLPAALRLAGHDPAMLHGVLVSTVCVYGEDGRREPVRTTDAPRPASAYGRAKLAGESAWRTAGFGSATILRLGPVFTPDRPRNLAVRVALPGLPLRLRVVPEPRFSLCSGETLRRLAAALVDAPAAPGTVRVVHAVDPEPWTFTRAAAWLDARPDAARRRATLPLPRAAVDALFAALHLVPGPRGRTLRSLAWKRFRDTVYVAE